jgi:hypothetical protein
LKEYALCFVSVDRRADLCFGLLALRPGFCLSYQFSKGRDFLVSFSRFLIRESFCLSPPLVIDYQPQPKFIHEIFFMSVNEVLQQQQEHALKVQLSSLSFLHRKHVLNRRLL